MKLKILFFPIAVIVAIWASIWVIKPDIMDIKSNIELKATKEIELQNVQAKLRTINSLVASLDSNAGKVKIINDYLPVSRDEEEIINKINQRATDSKVEITLLSVSDPEGGQLAQKKASAPIDPDEAAPVKARFINASVTVAGTYDNIRKFLNYIHSMEKMNVINSAVIGKDGENSKSGDLIATVDMNFDFFSPVTVEKNSNLSVFSQPELDFSVASKVEELLREKVADVTVGETGKENPFKP